MARGAMRVRLVDDLEPVSLLRAEARPAQPVVFSETTGGKPRDILGTGHAALFLVSDSFVAVLRAQHSIGWTTFPVEIRTKAGRTLGGYQGFGVTGRCGPLDQSKPASVILPPLSEKGRAVAGRRGIYFDPSTWDGSDVFVPATGGYVFVLEHVRDAMQRARLSNVTFDRATEVELIAV